MSRVFVSIGSNIDRDVRIRQAVAMLAEMFDNLSMSSVYETAAVGFSGDDFYNLVASFDTGMGVFDVADSLRLIEEQCGRNRGARRFAPRTMDIDLLLYDDMIINERGIHIPRDEILMYGFVLGPLSQIAGDKKHPVDGRSYRDLWSSFSGAGQAMKEVPFSW